MLKCNKFRKKSFLEQNYKLNKLTLYNSRIYNDIKTIKEKGKLFDEQKIKPIHLEYELFKKELINVKNLCKYYFYIFIKINQFSKYNKWRIASNIKSNNSNLKNIFCVARATLILFENLIRTYIFKKIKSC